MIPQSNKRCLLVRFMHLLLQKTKTNKTQIGLNSDENDYTYCACAIRDYICIGTYD